MAVKNPQSDLKRGLSGARDAWDSDFAGVVIRDDYFATTTVSSPIKVKVGGVFTSLLSQKVKLSGTFTSTTPKVKVSGVFV